MTTQSTSLAPVGAPALPLPIPAVLFGIAALALLLYAGASELKPPQEWNWIDVMAEGGTAIMAGVWTWLVLTCRPLGRVTLLLAGGLFLVMLGAWIDCLDEFFRLAAATSWAKAVESALTLGGMVVLTTGLWFWRHEQFSLNEVLRKRERLFREHRSFDRVTQLADAGYLRKQLVLERERRPRAPCALLLLDISQFHLVGRLHGTAEADRLLQAVTHLLLLNLRNDDLLCRYAGDRYTVLLPETTEGEARAMGAQLERAVASLAHYTRAGSCRLQLQARVACAVAGHDPDQLIAALNRAMEQPAPAAQVAAA